LSGVGRLSCFDCKLAYKYTADDTPCSTCFPGVHKRNSAVFEIYTHVQGQYIMSMSGAVAIDVLAIHKTLDCYGLPYDEDRLDLISSVEYLSGVSISTQHAESKRKTKK